MMGHNYSSQFIAHVHVGYSSPFALCRKSGACLASAGLSADYINVRGPTEILYTLNLEYDLDFFLLV
jgi:hypothetical protein